MIGAENTWSPSKAVTPILWSLLATLTGLALLAYPRFLHPWIALFLVTVPTLFAFKTSNELFPDALIEENYLRFVLLYIVHMSYLFLLRGPQNPNNEPSSGLRAGIKGRWMRAYKTLFNYRGVGTSWELPLLWYEGNSIGCPKPSVPSSPPVKSRNNEKESKEEHSRMRRSRSRTSAIFVRLAYMLLNFVALCIYYEYIDIYPYLGEITASDFAHEKEGLLRRIPFLWLSSTEAPITQRELLVRAGTAINYVLPTYLWGTSYHDFWAIVFIGAGLDEDWEWPSLFRTMADAYSMRRFWGVFWHRLIYRAFSAHAAALSGLLGLPKRGMVTRIANNLLVFAFSALWHGAVSWKQGNECAWNRSLMFWLLQPLAFVIEGFVQAWWRKQVPAGSHPIFERVVGYVWVFVWMFWSTPKSAYPLACFPS